MRPDCLRRGTPGLGPSSSPAHRTTLARGKRNSRAGGLAAFLLILWIIPAVRVSSAPAVVGEGLSRVTAGTNWIRLQGRGPGFGGARITELDPAGVGPPREVTSTKTFPAEFTVEIPRFEGGRDRLFSSFQIWSLPANDPPRALGTNRFVEAFDFPAKWERPFPVAASKKGLQVQMVEDALALGIKHAALNLNLTSLIETGPGTSGIPWEVDGETVRLHAGVVAGLDRQVLPLIRSNVVVSLILLTYASGDPVRDRMMLHPRFDPRAPNHLAAFNTTTMEGARCFRAGVEFLADHYGQPEFGGRVANYILGNEVNSHWFWANMGRVTMEDFAEDYLRTARMAATALRKFASEARLYLSLEHHWNIRYPGGDAGQAFPGRVFLDYFNHRAREQGDFSWHVAFHPYPENLFEPRTWNDRSATAEESTPRITFKNIELLPRYLRRPEFLRADGTVRRVILSEQGFHTASGPDGELWQAAGYAYAYAKCSRIDGIDAFILHRHVDHGGEGGLRLGLWTRDERSQSPAAPGRRKRIYEVFRAADTPAWEEAFAFALPVIGIQNWRELGSETHE